MADSPLFLAQLEACDAALGRHVDWSLLDVLRGAPGAPTLDRVDVIQPTLFAVQVALAALWRAWGVRPAAVVGHSMGEVAAAHVAGALSLDDAARVIALRSRIVQRAAGRGGMLAVELTPARARALIARHAPEVAIAAINSPEDLLLSGPAAAIDAIEAALEAAQVFCRRVQVDYASHSPMMDALRPPLLGALASLTPRASEVAIYSTVSASVVDGAALDADYWARNLREPVLLAPVVERLLETGRACFLELSPHPVLAWSLQRTLSARGAAGVCVASLRRDRAPLEAMSAALAALYAQGVTPRWSEVPATGGRLELPRYAWEHKRHWPPPPRPRARAAREGHPLLGARIDSAARPDEHLYEVEVERAAPAYLADHVVEEVALLPGAAYLEALLSAAQQTLEASACVLTDVTLRQAMPLLEGTPRRLQVQVTRQGAELRLTLHSRAADDEGWQHHATARARAITQATDPQAPDTGATVDLEALRARCQRGARSGEALYARLARTGLRYGPAFQGMARVDLGQDEALGALQLTEAVRADAGRYTLHPALLDAAFHALSPLLDADEADDAPAYLPVAFEALAVRDTTRAPAWVHARRRASAPGDDPIADLTLLDAQGRRLVEVQGLQARALSRARQAASPLLQVAWRRAAALPEPDAASTSQGAGRWLLLADRRGVAARLAGALRRLGAQVVTVGAREAPQGAAADVVLGAAQPDELHALLERVFDGASPDAVVHLWALDASPIDAGPDLALCSVMHLMQALARRALTPRLSLVTAGAQPVEEGDASPIQHALWGMGRCLAHEHAACRPRCVDLSEAPDDAEVAALLRELVAGDDEREVALRGDARWVARLLPVALEALPAIERVAAAQPFKLTVTRERELDSLALTPLTPRPPGPGEVEVEVVAAGVNFSDLVKITGLYPERERGELPFGLECVGLVRAVGQGVEDLAPGDPVIAAAPGGAFASRITLPACLVVRRPEALSWYEAVTIPCTFLTAYLSLVKLARLAPGERVLIHSATGGVGQAALQIARRAGAEVFATAGSPHKRALLASMGVRHVMSSRTLDFADQILEATHGEGVDVVLNALSGDAIEQGLRVTRSMGRFVEIGRTDIYQNRALGMRVFNKNISYFAVDLGEMILHHPARLGGLLNELIDLFKDGALTPLPRAAFPASRAGEAFRLMARAQHTGKLIIDLRDPFACISNVGQEALRCAGDGAYLITGGTGALGLLCAERLAARGAKTLILVARRPPGDEARARVERLRAGGARVLIERADISVAAEVEALIARVQKDARPLRGVIHAAGVLEDGLLVNQTRERMQRVLAPKVAGAWHLHRATRDAALEHFVLFSSAAATLGSSGQTGYAAANAFMDGLAHRRRRRGLAALSINWGAWAGVGLAAAQQNRGERLERLGLHSIIPDEGVDWLERLMLHDITQVGVIPLNLDRYRAFHSAEASTPRFSELLTDGAPSATSDRVAALLQRDLRACDDAPSRRARVTRFLQAQAARVLGCDEDAVAPRIPLSEQGFDSLLSLELRGLLEDALEMRLPATLLWTYPTITTLSAFFCASLDAQREAEAREAEAREPEAREPAPPPTPGPVAAALDALDADLGALSDDEVARLLAAELEG